MRHNILFSVLTVLLIALTGLYIWRVSLQTLRDDIAPADIASRLEGVLQAGDENALKRSFGVTGGQLGDYVYFRASDVMNVDELLIVRAKDDAALERLERAAEARLAAQKRAWSGYGTTQLAALENAVIVTRGRYFFYAVSDRADQWEAAFEAALNGK